MLEGTAPIIQKELLDKHYYRKHVPKAYYGQE
jgi:ribulose-5-phosphate 4-epimerase/fuculose-1-phosphate aldolase